MNMQTFNLNFNRVFNECNFEHQFNIEKQYIEHQCKVINNAGKTVVCVLNDDSIRVQYRANNKLTSTSFSSQNLCAQTISDMRSFSSTLNLVIEKLGNKSLCAG